MAFFTRVHDPGTDEGIHSHISGLLILYRIVYGYTIILSCFYTWIHREGREVLFFMISREDFMFTVGYQGNTAIVDGVSKRRFGKLHSKELAEKGMFKPALCAALYSGEEEDYALVIEQYNKHATKKIGSVEELKKVFGVSKVPDEIEKVIKL
jgi:hypothetical protein